jgi:hypothetical protein
MKERALRHVVRLSAVVTAAAPVVVSVLSSLPWEWAVSLSATALAAGEVAQRVENAKTLRAFVDGAYGE